MSSNVEPLKNFMKILSLQNDQQPRKDIVIKTFMSKQLQQNDDTYNKKNRKTTIKSFYNNVFTTNFFPNKINSV